jgi:hypothetical protein
MPLRIFAITRPGLLALTFAVAALWTCVGLETSARRKADRDIVASLRTLDHLRHHGVNSNDSGKGNEGSVHASPAREPMHPFHISRPFAS